MRWYLGIEIGGTKLQLAVGRGEGEPCRAFWRAAVEPSQRAGRIQQQILEGVGELLSRARLDRTQIAGVGIGFGGPVDSAGGKIVTSHQVDGWEGFPLVTWFADNFGWSAVLHNDADTAAYAESQFGAGKGFDPLLYMTVGSGIGGGLVCAGKIFRGSGAGAMEVGHLRPGHAPRQVSLSAASVESIASGFGIEDRARRMIAEWEEATVLVESRFGSTPQDVEHIASEPVALGRRFPERFAALMKLANGDRARITTRLIAQAAARGDRLSSELLSDATDVLGWALAQAITLINPARIVIGGGVSLIGQELFFEPVRRACQAEVFRPFAGIAQIVPAALGEEVVVHGALALARAAFHREPPLKAFSPEEEPS